MIHRNVIKLGRFDSVQAESMWGKIEWIGNCLQGIMILNYTWVWNLVKLLIQGKASLSI